jgi:hypothetical protein
MFTPERIAIEKLDGTVVAQRYAPRYSFAGHQMHTRPGWADSFALRAHGVLRRVKRTGG